MKLGTCFGVVAAVAVLLAEPGLLAAEPTSLAELNASYAKARSELETMRSEVRRLESSLEQASREREERRAAIEQERDAALVPLTERISAAHKALGEVKLLPVISQDEKDAEEALRAAQVAYEEAKAQHEEATQKVLNTGSRIAVWRVRMEKLAGELTAARDALKQAEATRDRISTGDPDALMDAARAADEEKQALLEVFFAFEPEFDRALQAPRMLVSLNIPPMYKAKEKLDAIETNYCGRFAADLRAYVDKGLDGIRTFASEGNESDASLKIFRAKLHKPDPEDAKIACTLNVASAALEGASTAAASAADEVKKRLAEQAEIESGLPKLEASLPEKRNAAAMAAAEEERAKAALTLAKNAFDSRIPEFARVRERLEAERKAAIKLAQSELDSASSDFDAARDAFAKKLASAGSSSDADSQLVAKKKAVSRQEAILRSLEDQILGAHFRRDLSAGLRIETKVDKFVGWRVCVRITNKSRFAIRALQVDLMAGSRDVASISRVDIIGSNEVSFDLMNDLDRTSLFAHDAGAGTLSTTFSGTNRYKEDIPYLLPDETSAWSCWRINRNVFAGDSLRRLEAAGVSNPARWAFALGDVGSAKVAFSQPDKNRTGALIFYAKSPRELYGDRLAAAGSGSISPTVEPKTEASQTGFSPTRAQIRDVQARLNELGFDAGPADGLMGANTRGAIGQFQKSKGQPEDGVLTKEIMEAILSFASGTSARAPSPLPADRLTGEELSRVRHQVARCWLVPAGARASNNLAVDVDVSMNADRTVRSASVVDQKRMTADPFFRAAAESALRALRNPSCTPLNLPKDRPDAWRQMRLTFDPREMLN